MSKITFILFDEDAEIISYESEQNSRLEMMIFRRCEGYIRLGNMTEKLTENKCVFNTQSLADGEYEPILTANGEEIRLPKLICKSGIISPKPADGDFIRKLSLRTIKLADRLSDLEDRLKGISDSVYGSTIF